MQLKNSTATSFKHHTHAEQTSFMRKPDCLLLNVHNYQTIEEVVTTAATMCQLGICIMKEVWRNHFL